MSGMKIREINAHVVTECSLPRERVQTLGQAGPGGAYSLYRLTAFDENGLPSRPVQFLKFQTGNPYRSRINGTTNEVLLAIVLDRLGCFQGGQFPCAENAEAIELIEDALEILKDRTRRRLAKVQEEDAE